MFKPPGQTVLVAGATGVVGRRLCRLLVQDGWLVSGTTRYAHKAPALRELGVDPIIVNVFDERALRAAVLAARPAIVIHQLTDLPPALDPARMPEFRLRNARIRQTGTHNLVAAARAAGVARMVAQSIAFAYAPGPTPYREDWPLNLSDPDSSLTARAVASLEAQVLSAPLTGIILRYGKLYGPDTGFDQPPPGGPVHIDAAADAARRAISRGPAGIFNVAEEDGILSSAKARECLGWDPAFRIDG